MNIRDRENDDLIEAQAVGRTCIVVAGDFCPIKRTAKAILTGRAAEMVASIDRILKEADLSIVNLEAPLTTTESGIRKTGPNLRGDPECVEFLEVAGFDVANLANNHIRDMGSDGVLDTLAILKEKGISTVGAGGNLRDALEPLILEGNCGRIAILSYAENEFSIADEFSAGAANLDPILNLEQIKRISSENDVTIVLVHGGNEYCPVPSPRMRQRYKAFAEAGASAVVATHTHCPQGVEMVNGVPIFYSMGNFLFDTPFKDVEYSEEDFWWKGYMVKLDLAGDKVASFELVPVSSGPDGTAVKLLEGDKRNLFLGYIQHISDLIQDGEKLNSLWHAWCLKEGPQWIEYFKKAQYPMAGDDISMNALILRNGFTCEAHHEVVLTFLRMMCEDRIEEAAGALKELEGLQKGIH